MSLSYKIEKNELFGRYMVASKDLKEGETILKEMPITVGSPIKAFPICFKCCIRISYRNNIACSSCNLALICSPKCNGNVHTSEECDALKSSELKPEDIINNPQIIMPLRCMLLRRYHPEKWVEFMEMEAHLDKRANTYIYRLHKTNVEDVLKEIGFLNKDDLESNLVQKVCGILDVNSFEIRPPCSSQSMIDPSQCLRGIFLQASLMAHNCIGNTLLSVDDDFEMSVNASTFIPEGDIIYFNYGNGLQGTHDRRRHLKAGKYFDCMCKRCSDKTELGTNLSSILCTKCKIGLVQCTQPLKNSYAANWACEKCKATFKGTLIETTLNICKDKLSDITNLKEAEKMLKKIRLTLGPQHYLILEVKQTIITMLNGENTKQSVKRKIRLCEDLITFLKVIEPGISRLQGIAQYELHTSIINLANKEYNNKDIGTEAFLTKLQSAENALKSAIKYLLYEPPNSPEGRLAQKALTDLRVLRSSSSDIRRIVAMQEENFKENKKQRRRQQK